MTKKLISNNTLHKRLQKQYLSVVKAISKTEKILEEEIQEEIVYKDNRATKVKIRLSSLIKRKANLEAKINCLEASLGR